MKSLVDMDGDHGPADTTHFSFAADLNGAKFGVSIVTVTEAFLGILVCIQSAAYRKM